MAELGVTLSDQALKILVYYFLLMAEGPQSQNELDDRIEKWFENNWNCNLNFEIDDALEKLKRFELVSHDNDGLRALSLEEAKRRLDFIWDNYFEFNT